jgi:hypothetical protein
MNVAAALAGPLQVLYFRRFQKPIFKGLQLSVFRCSLVSAHVEDYFVSQNWLG